MYIYRLDAGSDSETSLRENIKPYSQKKKKAIQSIYPLNSEL